MYLFPYCITWVVCEDYLTCDIAFNAVMPLSRASTRGRYSRIEGVTGRLVQEEQRLKKQQDHSIQIQRPLLLESFVE